MRSAGSWTAFGASAKPRFMNSGISAAGTPALKKAASGAGAMSSQTKYSPGFPSSRTARGARSRKRRSSRSAHMVGGSTKWESAEINRESAIDLSSFRNSFLVFTVYQLHEQGQRLDPLV